MEEAPENGKESPHSVHANGLIDLLEWNRCSFLNVGGVNEKNTVKGRPQGRRLCEERNDI